MKIRTVLIIVGCAIAGCSSVVRANQVAPNTPPGNPHVAGIAPDAAITEEVAAGPSSTPSAAQTKPTPIILVPIQGNSAVAVATPTPISLDGWKTFTDVALGVVLNYPPDWSVTERSSNETAFVSPQGTAIVLKTGGVDAYSNEIRIGNQRCQARTNAHSLTADVCVDTASFSYSARFAFKSTSGATQSLTLTITTRDTASVFEGMFDSVRPAK